jgi:hypothetical protein
LRFFVVIGMTREEISKFCTVSLAKVLSVPKETVKTDTAFNRLGLDSAMLVYLAMDLEESSAPSFRRTTSTVIPRSMTFPAI